MKDIQSIAILYVPLIFLLIGLTVSSFRKQYIEVQKRTSRALLEIAIVNILYLTVLITRNYNLIRVLYTFMFILIVACLTDVFWYIVKLAEFDFLDSKIGHFITTALFSICALMELPNLFQLWSFSLLRFKLHAGHYYTYGIRAPHYVYMSVVYGLFGATLVLAIIKAIKVASIYKRRYFLFIVIYTVAFAGDIYFAYIMRMKWINLSYAVFGFVAIQMYWDCYRSSHQYQSFIDHFLVDRLEVGLVMFNYLDTLESFNKQSSRWFGLNESHQHRLTRSEFISQYKIPVEDEFTDQEFRFRYKEDYIDGRLEVLKEDGQVTGVFFVFYNITKEENSRRDLEKYAKNRNDFIQNMTHELRTPLNAVIGFSNQLMDSMPKGEYRDQVLLIDKSGKLILRYIDEMTDMMRLSDGLYQVEKDKFRTTEQMKLVKTYSVSPELDSGVSFESRMDPMLPTVMYGDANSINIIIGNILDNAFKYTERGKVSIETKWIQEDVYNGEMEVIVSDTGCGMSEEVLENIYLAFSVGQDVQHKHENGIGIGLFITKKLLDLLGGTILVESHLNIGTKVKVTIPLEVVDSTPISTSLKRENLQDVDLLCEKVKILVVEDDPINARSIKRQLEHYKAEVTLCDCGESALEELAVNANYDLIFMDYIMPGLNGIETAKRIRASGLAVRKIPIIAVTADVSAKRKDDFHKAKMNDVLFKPFELNMLADVLTRWLPPEKVILLKKEDKKLA